MNDDNTQNNQFPPAQNDDDQNLTYSSQASQDHDLDKGQSPFLGADDPIPSEDISAGKRKIDVDNLSRDDRVNETVLPESEEVNDTRNVQEIGEDYSVIDPTNVGINTGNDDTGDDTTGRLDTPQDL